MRRGVLKGLIAGLKTAAAGVRDKRKPSNRLTYRVSDIALSAFAVFYFQHPSLLNFQQAMERKRHQNNLRTLFEVGKIPGGDQIRNIVDTIEPKELYGAFDNAHRTAREDGILEEYRVLNGTIPVALDGVWYFSSKEIHCDHCLKMEKRNKAGETETLYYHDMVAAVVVKPGSSVVLPLIPEFVRNEDGTEKSLQMKRRLRA